MPITATVLRQDCFAAFAAVPDASVDAVITDPPYFLDTLGDDWDHDTLARRTTSTTVSSLASGMRFDPAQGLAFQEFMGRVAAEALRVLKPGGFLLAFSAPRLYHRLGVAVEDAGFEVRDLFAWLYTQNQMKAMSVARFLDDTDLDPRRAEALRRELADWKTPQVKSCLEPIVLAQKPKTDTTGAAVTFLDNWRTHRVGLLNTAARVGTDGQMSPANVLTTAEIGEQADRAFLVPKPGKAERVGTEHLSVKPLALMDQLVRLTTLPGALVLDPFNGSGSTGVSALSLCRNYLGFELSPVYFEQSRARFAEAFAGENPTWTVSEDAFSVSLPDEQAGEAAQPLPRAA